MKKNSLNISLKGIFSNEKFKYFISIAIIIAILFSLSVCCFASQYEYGALKIVDVGGIIALSSLSKLIYSTFGTLRYGQSPDIDNNNRYTSSLVLSYRTYAVKDTASYKTSEFFNFIGNNAMNLLMQVAFNVPADYFAYAPIDSQDTLHFQLSFSSSTQLDTIGLYSSVNKVSSEYVGTNSTNFLRGFGRGYGTNWNSSEVTQDGNLYVINADIPITSSCNYIYLVVDTIESSNSYNTLTIDKSLVPYWNRNESAGGSPINNYYNITQSSTDLSGVYQYLDLISEWLDLIQETEGDTLDTLIDIYSDVMSRLNSINTSLTNISGNVSSINGNVSSIFSMLAGINDRIQNIMSNIAMIRSTLSDQYSLVDDIDYYMQNYMPLLQDIYDILEDIYSSVSGIEDQFLEWSNRQTVGSNHSNMKTYISSIFDYVKRFFSAVFDFTSGILSFSPFNALSNFDGGNMFAN